MIISPHRCAPPSRLALALLLLSIVLGAQACRSPRHSQVADPDFDASVARPAADPAAGGDAVRVLVDEAHDNFHTAGGRYRPFAELLRGDGFVVDPSREPLGAGQLAGAALLVIANASPPDPDQPASAFTAAEIAAVEAWVRDGGGLLLVADHSPFGAAARELAAAFGVVMHDDHLRDPEHADPELRSPYILVFERQAGLVADHAITRGRGPEERVDRVVTFGGQALEAPAAATPLLSLGGSAEIVDDPNRGPDAETRSAAGMVQALALEHGRGRVVVVGEAAALTSQVIRGEVAERMGREELRIGMSRTDTDNRWLALNTARWLVGRL